MGNKTGVVKSATEVHRDEDWHSGAHVWIVNSRDEVLLQRRSARSFHSPGLLDPSTTGHVNAGENSVDAARREVREELGIDIPTEEFKFLFSFSHSIPVHGKLHNEFNDVYLVLREIPIGDLTLEDEEVGEVFFMPYAELKRGVLDGTLPMLPRKDGYLKLFEVLDAFFEHRRIEK